MSDLLISVIVPVYKVEEYLTECVESIVNQTYKNTEIILVDDGSPDNCPLMCDEFAKKDSRIKAIHKVNGGLSSARNAGINSASGDYIIFIDSDDYWLLTDGLEKLVRRIEATEADILSFGYVKLSENGEIKPYFNKTVGYEFIKDNKQKQLEQLTKQNLFIASACNKIIKTEILKDTVFKAGVVSEDIEWCARLMGKARSFDFLHINFYCYRMRSGSISHSISDKSCIDLKDAVLGCIRAGENADSETKESLYRYTAVQLASFIAVQAYAKNFQRECIKQLSNYKYILRYFEGNKKVKYMYIGTKIFGLKLWCFFIRKTKFLWDRLR